MSDYFPSEILFEIFLKLPVRTLIRCTGVCKSWKSIITSPIFINTHLSKSDNHAILRRYEKTDRGEYYSLLQMTENGPFTVSSSSELEFPFKSRIGYHRIVGTCDGLVCLSDDFFWNPSLSDDFFCKSSSSVIIIWNPCVRCHVVLPDPIINPVDPHMFVLGFGVANHAYKVVRLVCFRNPGEYGISSPAQAEVYSLGTRGWRTVQASHVRLRTLEFMWCQVLLKGIGVVHWLAYEFQVDVSSFRCSILTFDVGDEVFGEIMLPDELSRASVSSLSLFSIGESLGVIVVGNGSRDVWIMKEYGVKESWTKLYMIDFVTGLEKVVSFPSSGEALFAFQSCELVSYNLENRQTKNLGIYGSPRSFYFDNFEESLLFLGGYCGASNESSCRAAVILRMEKLVFG